MAAACYSTLARKQKFSWIQSLRVTLQPLLSPLISASQIPHPKGSMTIGHGQQLRANCIRISPVGDDQRAINVSTQNLLNVFYHPKRAAKIVILSDFCGFFFPLRQS